MSKIRLPVLIVACLVAVSSAAFAQPSKLDLDTADYQLRQFERYVEMLRGETGSLDAGRQALETIAKLKEKYPDHPEVQKLTDRAKAAALKLRGDRIEVTPAMLAYRELETKRRAMLSGQNEDAWLLKQEEILASTDPVIARPLPAPDPAATAPEELEGARIILPGVRYPDGVFLHYGQPYVAVGSAAQGYYFVNASSRSFVGAYEAVRRYQRLVSAELPGDWTILGHIEASQVMVPDGGDAAQRQAYSGWTVLVDVVWVPGHVLGVYDPESTLGGAYVGEREGQSLLESLYTVREVPFDATPEQLLGVFLSAVKEKNYGLYLAAIHPAEQETAIQREWLERKWDMLQRRVQKDVVHAVVSKQDEIEVIQGGMAGSDLELLGEFLTEEERKDLADDGRERIEEVTIWVKCYDDTGRMRDGVKPVRMRRQPSVGGGRWHIVSGYVL